MKNMPLLNILVIGRHEHMLHKVMDMLREKGYRAAGALSNQEALSIFSADTFDAVIIGGGVDGESRDYFHAEFPKIHPDVKIIDTHPQNILSDLQKAFPAS